MTIFLDHRTDEFVLTNQSGMPIRVPGGLPPHDFLAYIDRQLEQDATATESYRRKLAEQISQYSAQGGLHQRYLELHNQASGQQSGLANMYIGGSYLSVVETDEHRWTREAKAEVDALCPVLDSPAVVIPETRLERWVVPVLRWLLRVLP